MFVDVYHQTMYAQAMGWLVRPQEVRHLFSAAELTAPPVMFVTRVADLMVQRLSYIPEPHARPFDRWQLPSTTLARGGGDCEDFCIIGVSMLLLHPAVQAYVVGGNALGWGRSERHTWVEGRAGVRAFFFETTTGHLLVYPPGSGWMPSHIQLPPGYHRTHLLGPIRSG